MNGTCVSDATRPGCLRTLRAALAILTLLTAFSGSAQVLCPPVPLGQQSHGGSDYDFLKRLIVAPDGTLLVGGSSRSRNHDRTNTTYGFSDYWVYRLAPSGTILQERSYGGISDDYFADMKLLDDGGLILGGLSYSGASGNKTTPHYGGNNAEDYWILRTDAAGDVLWERNYGGFLDDVLTFVLPLRDGGFLVGGNSRSDADGNKLAPNLDSSANHAYDGWILRLDANGDRVWEKAYGGMDDDLIVAAHQTADGGFLLAGTSQSQGTEATKRSPHYGYQDYWVIRIDAEGDRLWDQSYGGQIWDILRDIVPTSDGGFLLVGQSSSGVDGTKTSQTHGYADAWVVRIDADGNQLWDYSYGGLDTEEVDSAIAYGTDGFVLGGTSSSFPSGNKTSPWYGVQDAWVLRLDATGGLLWQQTFGGLNTDLIRDVVVLPRGTLMLGGESYSQPEGTKTSPFLGDGDHWFIQLGLEMPEDCDADGVPNAIDVCTNTPPGAVVDAHGCAILQYCPCDYPWAGHRAFVDCVLTNSLVFLESGLITEAERAVLLARAENAECPVIRQTVIFAGLTNVAKGDAYLTQSDSYADRLGITELGPMGLDGVSVHVGEADSGIYIYPDAYIWGSYGETWFLTGTAYGTLDGRPHVALSTVHGTKPYYEQYPIDVDLSPLAPVSLTYLVYVGDHLEAEAIVPGSTSRFEVFTSQYPGPRVNPLWIQADGSVGVLVDFTNADNVDGYPPTLRGPFGDLSASRIFIRADQPAHTVSHLSRVDIVGGGGLGEFSFVNLTLGVFRRSHQALGASLFEPHDGQLTMRQLRSGEESEMGVSVELQRPHTFELDLEPVSLAEPGSSLRVTSSGKAATYNSLVSSAFFDNQDGHLHLYAELSQNSIEVKSFKNGILTGSVDVTNSISALGFLEPANGSTSFPVILSFGFLAGTTTEIPAVQFLLDQTVTWTLQDGSALEGDQFRIEGTEVLDSDFGLTSVSLLSFKLPSFTITGEQDNPSVPAMSIGLEGAFAVLSWPQRSAPYVLEAAQTVDGVYQPVDHQRTLQSGVYTVRLSVADVSTRFFRLRLNAE